MPHLISSPPVLAAALIGLLPGRWECGPERLQAVGAALPGYRAVLPGETGASGFSVTPTTARRTCRPTPIATTAGWIVLFGDAV
jgi:hypothetical protein